MYEVVEMREEERMGMFCYFHPKEVTVGVCPLCLNERLLLLLASKQSGSSGCRRRISLLTKGTTSTSTSTTTTDTYNNNGSTTTTTTLQGIMRRSSTTTTTLPKIFDLGSFLHKLEVLRPKKSDNDNDHDDSDTNDASTSQDDSFISIKFEDNGVGSWEKGNVANNPNMTSWNHEKKSSNKEGAAKSSVVEHVKPRVSSMRWRKRIGHLFHLARWKRSSRGGGGGSMRHVEGVKVRNGWIRSLTKRRAKE